MIWRLLALAEQLDDGLLRQVFTHSSWVAERGRSYERLEFLGDSVLSLAVTTELYRRFPEHSEGSLARLRAYIVSRATCAKVATRLGLPAFVRRFGIGHEAIELDQLVSNENILADLTESLIGAVYLTYGLDVVRPAVIEAFAEHISFAERSYVDFKTELQEQLAKGGRSVVYHLVETVGPPHAREFVLEAIVDGHALGRGVGASKKRAEQDAAAEALRELSGDDKPKRRRVRGRRHSGAVSEAEVSESTTDDELETRDELETGDELETRDELEIGDGVASDGGGIVGESPASSDGAETSDNGEIGDVVETSRGAETSDAVERVEGDKSGGGAVSAESAAMSEVAQTSDSAAKRGGTVLRSYSVEPGDSVVPADIAEPNAIAQPDDAAQTGGAAIPADIAEPTDVVQTSGGTVLRSYSVEIGDGAHEGAAERPGESHGAIAGASDSEGDADDSRPASDQGVEPPHTDGGV